MGLSWRHPGSAPPVSARASRVLLGRDPYRDPYLTLSPRLRPSFWADSRLGVCVYFINSCQVDLMSTFYCHTHTHTRALTVCELKYLISTLSVTTTWPNWLSNIHTVVSPLPLSLLIGNLIISDSSVWICDAFFGKTLSSRGKSSFYSLTWGIFSYDCIIAFDLLKKI